MAGGDFAFSYTVHLMVIANCLKGTNIVYYSRYENYHAELNINKKETIMMWYANMSFYEYYIHKKSNF